MNILGGVIGAVVGFVAGLLLFEVSGAFNKADPIASGMTALLFFGPAGAVGGAFLGVWLVTRIRAASVTIEAQSATPAAASSVAWTSLKAIGVVVVLVALAGGLYAWYAYATATPWLRPGGVVLEFELRLPPGSPTPAADDIKIELQTDLNTMPGKLRGDGIRREGDHVVIAGNVDLAFRTPHRQVEIKIKGQPDRLHRIGLKDTAPHSPALGPWQREADGSEIRYRANWPGEP